MKKLLVIAMLLVLVGCVNQPTKVRIGYFRGVSSIPLIVAYEEGYFAEQGLDVALVSFAGRVKEILPTVEAGAIDCSHRSKVSLFKAMQQGSNTCLLAEIYAEDSETGVFSLYMSRESPCMSDAECNLRIGYSFGGVEEVVFNSMNTSGKLSWRNIQAINVQNSDKAAFLLSKEIDASPIMPDEAIMIGEAVPLVKIMDSSESLPNSVFGAVYCNDEFAQDKAILQNIKTALIKASQLINSHPEDVKHMLVEGGYYSDIDNLEFPRYSEEDEIDIDKLIAVTTKYAGLALDQVKLC